MIPGRLARNQTAWPSGKDRPIKLKAVFSALFLVFLDRIYRIYRIFFSPFPEEREKTKCLAVIVFLGVLSVLSAAGGWVTDLFEPRRREVRKGFYFFHDQDG